MPARDLDLETVRDDHGSVKNAGDTDGFDATGSFVDSPRSRDHFSPLREARDGGVLPRVKKTKKGKNVSLKPGAKKVKKKAKLANPNLALRAEPFSHDSTPSALPSPTGGANNKVLIVLNQSSGNGEYLH